MSQHLDMNDVLPFPFVVMLESLLLAPAYFCMLTVIQARLRISRSLAAMPARSHEHEPDSVQLPSERGRAM